MEVAKLPLSLVERVHVDCCSKSSTVLKGASWSLPAGVEPVRRPALAVKARKDARFGLRSVELLPQATRPQLSLGEPDWSLKLYQKMRSGIPLDSRRA